MNLKLLETAGKAIWQFSKPALEVAGQIAIGVGALSLISTASEKISTIWKKKSK